MSLDFLTMDDITITFPSYPRHSLYEFSGQSPQMPAYNVFHGPLPPQHPEAPPAAPMSSRNSTSQMPHASMAPLAPAARSKSSAETNHPVRKRITRACDQCNQLRTKCDGRQPCTHCTDLETECQYNREQKKRGKAPRKEFAQRAAAKYSCNNTSKLGLTDATVTKKKAKKSEAMSIRVARQAAPCLPAPPHPSFATAACLTPLEGIPVASLLPNSGGEQQYWCFERMPANSLDSGYEFVPVYDSVQLNVSGDVTGSETSFSTYAGRFSYHNGSGSEALDIGQKIPPYAGQPERAQLHGVKMFGEEPVSMDKHTCSWQNAIPPSQGPTSSAPYPQRLSDIRP